MKNTVNIFSNILCMTLFLYLLLISHVSATTADDMYMGQAVDPQGFMGEYALEAYLSNLIYKRSKREEGKTFYYDEIDFDNNLFKSATLVYYKNDLASGFNAGIFQTNDGKIVIAFGGTTASSEQANLIEKLADSYMDVITDLQLINNGPVPSQVVQTKLFIDEAQIIIAGLTNEHSQNRIYSWLDDVVFTGHSLGGGLAQFATLISGVPSVTFNTAPAPISPSTLSYIGNIDPALIEPCAQPNCYLDASFIHEFKIVNIMSADDPLTIVLEEIEDLESGLSTHSTRYFELQQTIKNNKYFKSLQENMTLADLLISINLINPTSKLNKSLQVIGDHASIDDTNFLLALLSLKNSSFTGFARHMKRALNIPDETNVTKLIYGERYYARAKSSHGISELIRQSYLNLDKLNLIYTKLNMPELYQYIAGTFTNQGYPIPEESNISTNLASKLSNYYYNRFYKEQLTHEVDMLYSALMHREVTNTQIENFANTYLNIGSLATEMSILATDTLTNISDEQLNVSKKKAIVSGALSSGKSTAIDMLPDEYKEVVTTIDNCLGVIPWFPSAADTAFTALVGAEVKKKASQVIDCAVGESVKATSRFYSFFSIQANLEDWQWHALAKNYLDVYYACGQDNNTCMASQLNGHGALNDQLDWLIDEYAYQGFNFRIRNGAKKFIKQYQQSVASLANTILDLVPNQSKIFYAYSNQNTKTLDLTVESLLLDEIQNELTLSFEVKNTLHKAIDIHEIEIIIITSAGRFYLPLEGNIDAQQLFTTYSANSDATPIIVPIALNNVNLFSDEVSEARVVVNVTYGAAGNFEDSIQRVLDIDIHDLIQNSEENAAQVYSGSGELAETYLEITLPDDAGRSITDINLKTIQAVAGDEIHLRSLLGSSIEEVQTQCWLNAPPDQFGGDYSFQSYRVWLINAATAEPVSVDAELSSNCEVLSFILPESGEWDIYSYDAAYENVNGRIQSLAGSFGTTNSVIAGDPSIFDDSGSGESGGSGDGNSDNPDLVGTHPLNDTGITTCSNATTNGLPCPVEGFPGQDAQYGRDALAAAGQLQKVGAGQGGFDYTKLDANGNDLPASATEWSCVRDNVTNLIWEVKTDDGGLRDKDNSYSWYNPDSATNGGHAGTEGDRSSHKYANDVNTLGLCGKSDWRLPVIDELISLLAYHTVLPTIESEYFPNTYNGGYWSSSSMPYLENARNVDFGYGAIISFTKNNGYSRIRLVVRGTK